MPEPLEQSVLMTTDGLDASGFLEHLKLPHYVTFRSMMERKQAMRAADPVKAERLAQGRSDCEVTDLSNDVGPNPHMSDLGSTADPATTEEAPR